MHARGRAVSFRLAWEYARGLKASAMSASDKTASMEAISYYELCDDNEIVTETYVGKSKFFVSSCWYTYPSHVSFVGSM